MKFQARYIRAASAAFLFCVSACGGGGGGASSVPPVTSATPTPIAVPSPQTVGDVRYVGSQPNGASIAYDQSTGTAVLDSGTQISGMPSGLPSSATALAYDPKLNSIIASTGSTIYQVSPSTGTTAIASGFTAIRDMTVDAGGNIYVIDNDHVASVTNGAPKALTPAGSFPYDSFASIWPHLAFDSKNGTLYVTNPVQDDVESVTTAGQTAIVAGGCNNSPSANLHIGCWSGAIPGTGSSAEFSAPEGIAYDPTADVLYMSDAGMNDIWTITPAGAANIFAGYGAAAIVDGNGLFAFFNDPYSIALDSSHGVLYVREYDAATTYVATVATAGTPAAPKPFPVTTFWLPSRHAQFGGMALASDGSAWFTASGGNTIANVTVAGVSQEYAIPTLGMLSGVSNTITVDPSGYEWSSVWSAQSGIASLIRFSPGGANTSYSLPAVPLGSFIEDTTVGPDDNLWYAERTSNGGSVGFITDAGSITQYLLPNQATFAPYPESIVAGSDGNIWYLLDGGSTIGRVTPLGQFLTPYETSDTFGPYRLVSDIPHGRVWFVDGADNVGYVTASGSSQLYSLGCIGNCGPTDIAIGTDGTPWVVEEGASNVAHVDAAGNVTRYEMPLANPGLYHILSRGDGTFWVDTYVGALFLFNPAVYDSSGLPYVSATHRRSAR